MKSIVYRGACTSLRRIKSLFCRLLSRRQLSYFLKYAFAAAGRICLQVLTKDRQNHRFSAGPDFSKSLYIFGIGAVMMASCENKAETGALVGAGVGIGAGALISPTPAGVLIGGAVGAVGGALIGAALDSADRDRLQRESPRTMNKIDRGEQLSMKDIERMSQAGITDDKIIGAIHSTGSVYHLSSSDVQELKDNGVSQRVIDFMLQTPYQ